MQIARNIMLKSTFSGSQRCRWQYGFIFILFSSCCLPNLRNPAKFSENSNSSRASKVIDTNRKRICNFLLVINSNFGSISYGFRDIDAFFSKIACFSQPHSCLTPHSGGTPCDINVIYTPLERTFNGLQFCRRQYKSIFIRFVVVGSEMYEISQDSERIRAYSM